MTEPSTDPHVLEPGHAPTPFTAAEIRDGTVAGKELWRRVEEQGEAPYLRLSRYLECDEDGAILERSIYSIDGEVLGEPEADRVTWLDLQGHASFPEDDVTIDDETISTVHGELACRRYTVDAGETTYVFWFAKDLPGMPVQQQVRQGDAVVALVTAIRPD